MNVSFLLVVLMAGVLSGCATTSSRSGGNLEIKVAQLERRLSDSDMEIQELKYEVSRLNDQIGTGTTRAETSAGSKKDNDQEIPEGTIRVSAAPEDVQKALRKAGYYDGAIDGKIGRKTIEAVKNFQKEHDLKVDGVIGAKTWQAMQNYLE